MMLRIPDYPLNMLSPILLICVLVCSCADRTAQRIVDDSIGVHGGSAYRSFFLQFDFRDRHYTVARHHGIFAYTREFSDSTGKIKDILNNDGFTRYRDNAVVSLTEERKKAFTSSVNAVIYFALLPFGLNDNPVNKEWIKETTIRGEVYDVVRVTFDGLEKGNDHQDIFLYWFHKTRHTMDYFAYSYQSDGGGIRFREAVNPRKIGGILFQDYMNFKPAHDSTSLEDLQSLFISGKLEKVSEIRLENIVMTNYPEKE